ncbi:MAG: hypothetical protein M1826_000852 [Phylliscum demangeonii]|nr:MAG: hypothetical protein M1826_000852 [Phylliscum demangeonii]
MPHSTSPAASSPGPDEVLPDADAGADLPQPSAPAPAPAHSHATLPARPDEKDGGPDAMDLDTTAEASSQLPAVQDLKMDDMFDDDDDDDDGDGDGDGNGDGDGDGAERARVPTAAPSSTGLDPEVLRAYYQRLLPFRPLFQWLNHSMTPTPTADFTHREFAFTLSNEAYLRYQAYPTVDQWRKEVLRLNPLRFEIGPVYSTNPRDRKTLSKSGHFRPVAKELVFDLDLTDYDEIRTCCDQASICRKCWCFVTMAIKVVDAALREDFGFRHVLWVYSGRRGAHAWVCDARARVMDDRRRRAIAGYLDVVRGGSQSGKKVNVKRPLHPHLSRSLDILKDHFPTDVLAAQDPWRDDEPAKRLLSLLPDKALAEALRKKWAASPQRASALKWADIDAVAKTGASRHLNAKELLEAKQDIVLEYSYPRLDVEVSKKLIHLLKSPFAVHPRTGRVCVPINLRQLRAFDPGAVPTVTELLAEIDAWDAAHGSSVAAGDDNDNDNDNDNVVDDAAAAPRPRLQDYEKTRLKPYVEQLKAFAHALMLDEKKTAAGVRRPRDDVRPPDAMEF